MPTGVRWSSRFTQFSDSNGDPLAAGTITFSLTGTSTPATTYSNQALTVANTNPLVLDAAGRLATDVWLDPAITYRAVLKNAAGSIIATDDPTANSDIAASIAAHNADPAAHRLGTESQTGFVEFATAAETQAGASTSLAVHPSGLATLTATDARRGLVEKATDAEVEAGTDTERYTTPAGIQTLHATSAEILAATAGDKHFIGPVEYAANVTKALPGSIKFPGGLEFKWGKFTSTTDAPESFSFPSPFATAVYAVFTTRIAINVPAEIMISSTTAPTISGFTVDRDSGVVGSTDFYYFAIGS